MEEVARGRLRNKRPTETRGSGRSETVGKSSNELNNR